MKLGRFVERSMGMSEAAWARHANPWSVWTRVPILPLLALAIYSREWIGGWAVAPVLLLVVWALVNPRAFPPPARTDNWASKGTFGERLWLARDKSAIPKRHARTASLLVAGQLLGVAILAYGLAVLDAWATFSGVVLTMGAKLWFVDRMVWLYEEVGDGRFTSGR